MYIILLFTKSNCIQYLCSYVKFNGSKEIVKPLFQSWIQRCLQFKYHSIFILANFICSFRLFRRTRRSCCLIWPCCSCLGPPLVASRLLCVHMSFHGSLLCHRSPCTALCRRNTVACHPQPSCQSYLLKVSRQPLIHMSLASTVSNYQHFQN